MIIKGNRIFGEEGQFFAGSIRIEDGKFTEIRKEEIIPAKEGEEVLDAGENMIIPGLVDIHFHGCKGVDFCDGTPEAIRRIVTYEEENGITSIVPATMTLSREELRRIFSNAGQYERKNGSVLRGINMEGPFVSMAKKGAQNGAYIHKPDVDFYREMQNLCNGMIRQVAIAPEEDQNLEVVKEIAKETVVSIAHTTADYETAKKAFEQGASHVTHLFNAMPGFTHREPGVVGAAFDNKAVFVEIICDGIHIHPSMMRAVFALFGAKRVCVISDSMMATGMSNGQYSLGGQPVTVRNRKATLADGTIAGSASNLMDCFRVLVKEGQVPLEDAIMAVTLTPARSLGLDKDCGSITVGKDSQLVILNAQLEIQRVINIS